MQHAEHASPASVGGVVGSGNEFFDAGLVGEFDEELLVVDFGGGTKI